MFASRSLIPAEKNYSPTEGEALAILFALKRFEHLIHGHQILVRTDHRPLSFVKSGSEHNRKLARWWAELLNYNITVEYLPGKKNVVADTLSRMSSTNTSAFDDTVLLSLRTREYEDDDGDVVLTCDNCGDVYYADRVDSNLRGLPFWYCSQCADKLDW